MTMWFHDRQDAGKYLADKLSPWIERDDVIVLALPRGGVPVAFEVAQSLHAPLDLMLVRKLGLPGQKELAMGALAPPDICVFNHEVIRNAAVSQEDIDAVVAKETEELKRLNRRYRFNEPPPDLKNKIVILVDDGAATGATMRAALNAVAQQRPARVIAALPVASPEAFELLQQHANDVLCLHQPTLFLGVSEVYSHFDQTTDEEVMTLLEKARHWGKGHVHFDGGRKHAGGL
ncbi:MAG: phosphoribosyltransferase [Alphaproteobacteria bacterium]